MILYGWKFNFPCRMRCNVRRDRPIIEARSLVERRGLSITDLLTLSTFSGVRAIRGLPVDVLFITDPVVRNDSTHQSIVLRSGIAPSRATLNSRRKRRWTVTTESLFLKNCSTAKTRCSTFHCFMATELIPLHYSQAEWGGCRPSLSRLLPISKTCVLFVQPCINATLLCICLTVFADEKQKVLHIMSVCLQP